MLNKTSKQTGLEIFGVLFGAEHSRERNNKTMKANDFLMLLFTD